MSSSSSSSGLSITQEWINVICSLLGGILSYAGSMLVIRLSIRRIRDNNNGRATTNSNPVYQKLMIALSVSDLLSTIAPMGTSFATIEGYPSSYSMAIGNTASCSIFGYLATTYFLTSSICNACLAAYFVLTVQKGWRQAQDFSMFTRICCFIIGVIPQSIAIIGFITESYNQLDYTPACWFTMAVVECDSSYSDDGQQQYDGTHATCTRGSQISEYLSAILIFLIVINSVFSTVNTYRVWNSYKQSIQQSRRYAFPMVNTDYNNSSSRTTTASSPPSSRRVSAALSSVFFTTSSRQSSKLMTRSASNRNNNFNDSENRNEQYLAEVTTQAIGFFVVYMNQFVWLIVGFVAGKVGTKGLPYGLATLGHFMVAMNGSLNAIVYIRPALKAICEKHNKSISKLEALWFVIWDSSDERIVNYLEEQQRQQQQQRDNHNTEIVVVVDVDASSEIQNKASAATTGASAASAPPGAASASAGEEESKPKLLVEACTVDEVISALKHEEI